MNFYYFNSSPDEHGYHEVHSQTCSYLPNSSHMVDIGYCDSCHEALSLARYKYPSLKFDGCYWCCPECHKL